MKISGWGRKCLECLKRIFIKEITLEKVRNDLAHGFGKIEFKDGSSYEGGFLFDEYHGEGKFIFSDEGFIEGKWAHGLFYEGIRIFVNGDKYEGEFLTIKDGGRQFQVFMHGKGNFIAMKKASGFQVTGKMMI